MSSKLPKPSGLRFPHVRTIESSAGNTENFRNRIAESRVDFKPKAQEAPPSTSRFQFSLTGRLARRSKSFSNLRDIIEEPTIGFNSTKLHHRTEHKAVPTTVSTEAKQPVQITRNVNSKTVKTASVKVNGSTGTKRPLANKSDDGVSKAKISKKIPDWDYKGRFNQLNERYKHAQECIRDMNVKVIQFDEVNSNHDKLLQETQLLRKTNQTLEIKCEDYDSIKSELSDLKNKHSNLEEAHKILLGKYQILGDKNEANLREISTLTNKYDQLSISHGKLLKDNKVLTEQCTEFAEKFNLYFEEKNSLSANLESARQENHSLNEMVSAQQNDLLELDLERRIQLNTIQDLKGNIRVFCRVRPALPSELDKLVCCINSIDENGLEIRKSRESVNQITGKSLDFKSEFMFDKFFTRESTQEELFEDLSQLVRSALDGYDVCVFAYGQTGSGKTYTMQGGEGDREGMIPRTIRLIFDSIIKLERRGLEYTVKASFLEIYNENVRDLLNLNNSQKMEICFNEGKGTTVTNLTTQPISSAEELHKFMRRAHRNRATATTNFNEHSSRSHAVTKIYLEGVVKGRNTAYTGSLNLVDLAGSENAKQSVAGDRLTETKNINKSLATLGDVISALYQKSKHVPYRNSKLTYLLQSCLGGNSKTLMIVNISPFEDCFGESINSLRFASKVKEVKTSSKKNKVVYPQMIPQKTQK